MFLQLLLCFCFFISSLTASSTTLTKIKTPVAVNIQTPPFSGFYDPEIVINKDAAIAFLYDAGKHEILYSVLKTTSQQWSTPKAISANASGAASACMDEQGFGAVCCPTQDGNVSVTRFEATAQGLIFSDNHLLSSPSKASSAIVCIAGPNKQVIAWKTETNYLVGFSPTPGSYSWKTHSIIPPDSGKPEDICLVGNSQGDCVVIYSSVTSTGNHGTYYSQRINVDNQSLDPQIAVPDASGSSKYGQYEGCAAINAKGDVLFSWTFGNPTNTDSTILVKALFKNANTWGSNITLQATNPLPSITTTNYQRTSKCALNGKNGAVAWEFRKTNGDVYYTDYMCMLDLSNSTLKKKPNL